MECPENLQGDMWPEASPCLNHLVLLNLECSPPSQLLLYPKLRRLDLSYIETDTLPEHFTGLTQLEHLVLQSCDLRLGSPQAVLALSQLHTLVMVTEDVTILPEKLLECASWPNLSLLRLAHGHPTFGFMYSADSHLVLLLLSNAFRAAGTKSPLVVNEIYTLSEAHSPL